VRSNASGSAEDLTATRTAGPTGDVLQVHCECGAPDCRETVPLSPAAREAFRRTNRAVLAPGHRLGRLVETRRSAAASVEHAHAVMAQAAHQVRRADRNRAAARARLRGRVLVVDDSDAFRRAAASVVSAARGLRLVGVAASGEEAIRLFPRLKPDLVLLDVHLPGIDGVEAARIIREEEPSIVVVLVSAKPDGFAAAAHSAGAAALVDKRELRPRTLDDLWLEHGPRD
jgi:two-component system invasion response regulator UvrY